MKKTLKWVVLPPEFIDETSHAPTGETLIEGMSHIVYDDWVDA